jgi:hypothetical protein
VLQQWNQLYFEPLGLHVRLELSDSAMRRPKKKSRAIRRPSLTYSTREKREWKNEDRKFVMVVAEIVNDQTSKHIHELAANLGRAEVPGDCKGVVSELPVENQLMPPELSNNEDMATEDLADVLCGMAELPADTPVELPGDEVDAKGRTDPVLRSLRTTSS